MQTADAGAYVCKAACCSLVRRLGVSYRLPAHRHHVSFARLDDSVGNTGVVNSANCVNGNGNNRFDLFRVVSDPAVLGVHGGDYLIAGSVNADGNTEIVDAGFLEKRNIGLRVFNGKTAGNPFVAGQFVADDEIGTCLFADLANNFKGKSHSVAEVATVFIGSLVGVGGHELLNEVTVRSVKLAAVKAGGLRSCRSLTKLFDYEPNFGGGHFMGHHFGAEGARNGGWRPRSVCVDYADLATGVMELNDAQRAPLMKSVGVFFEAGNVLVFPESADILMTFAGDICYRKVLRDDHRKATFGLGFVVCGKPFGAASVLLAQVHYHCGNDAAVFELSVIYRDWAEQTV